MKRLVVCLSLYLSASCATAATSPATVDYLKQLNLRYYCLNREGLQSFKCDLKLTIPREVEFRVKDALRRNNIQRIDECFAALNDIHYFLTVSKGKTFVEMTEPAAIGDRRADEFVLRQATAYEKLAQQVFNMWVEMTVTPFFTESNFQEADYQVKSAPGGFTVTVADGKGLNLTSLFNAQGNMLNTEGTSGADTVGFKTDFMPSQKGFVLRSLDLKMGQVKYQGNIEYGVVERFWLPKKWTFDFMIPGALAEEEQFTLEFSNFRLNNAATPQRPLVLLTGQALAPTFHHDQGTHQIEALNKDWAPSWNLQEPGLTEFKYGWDFGYQFGAANDLEKRSVRFWVTALDVEFSIIEFDVYISSQYPEGSCPYRVILAHEKTHVAINQRNYTKYKALLKRALEEDPQFPTRVKPWVVKNITEGKNMFYQHERELIDSVVKRFWREAGLENAQIDLTSNYIKETAKCNDW